MSSERATGLMAGKRGLIMGLANDKSIAWGIASALADQGAELAFFYQGEALKKRVGPLAARGRLLAAGLAPGALRLSAFGARRLRALVVVSAACAAAAPGSLCHPQAFRQKSRCN